MNSIENPSIIFKRRFKKVFQEINYIELKINRKEGLIFTNHSFSQSELLNSEHHKKIYSVTEKIGDDAENWYASGALNDEGSLLYHDYRDQVSDELHRLNLAIESRQPTWWESMKGSIQSFVVSVMNNIPILERVLLTVSRALSFLPGPAGKVASKMLMSVSSAAGRLTHKPT